LRKTKLDVRIIEANESKVKVKKTKATGFRRSRRCKV